MELANAPNRDYVDDDEEQQQQAQVLQHDLNQSGITNPEIQALMLQTSLLAKNYEELVAERKENLEKVGESKDQLREQSERKWLHHHGKKHLIDFDDKERQELKKYFRELDEDGSGGIGLNELEQPLISLGIAESREEVKKIIDSVDDDGNIEFKEFLCIIKGKEKRGGARNNSKNAAIIEFFKDMIQGRLGGGTISKDLPFELIVSTIRRKKFLDAIMSSDEKKRKEGLKVMEAFAKLQAQIRSTQAYREGGSKRNSEASRKNSGTSSVSFLGSKKN